MVEISIQTLNTMSQPIAGDQKNLSFFDETRQEIKVTRPATSAKGKLKANPQPNLCGFI
jgi:hypothetical protein